VTRSYEKWRSQKRAHVTGNSPAAAGAWPQIVVTSGELPRVVNEAEDALLGLGREARRPAGAPVTAAGNSAERRLTSDSDNEAMAGGGADLRPRASSNGTLAPRHMCQSMRQTMSPPRRFTVSPIATQEQRCRDDEQGCETARAI
jgi:hypothetical protein